MTNSELLDSLVLQHPEPQGFVNVNVTVNPHAKADIPSRRRRCCGWARVGPRGPNDDLEPYVFLVNCFLFFSHLFPYVLVVALAVWRS